MLVLRTLSKLGLAGLRLGYLARIRPGSPSSTRCGHAYNVNVLTLAAVDLLLDHLPELDQQAARYPR